MDVLVRIKRLVIRGQVRLTEKAAEELDADALTVGEAIESSVENQISWVNTLRDVRCRRNSAPAISQEDTGRGDVDRHRGTPLTLR